MECTEEKSGWSTETLKAYFENQLIKERELTRVLIESLKEQQTKDSLNAKESVTAALVASDKQTGAAFASAEKAIEKAEGAQKDYNVRSNEFRAALDDSNKEKLGRAEYFTAHNGLTGKIEAVEKTNRDFIPRIEYNGLHTALIAKIELNEKNISALSPKEVVETNLGRLRDDIKNLQLTNATLAGKASQSSVNIGYMFSGISIIIAIVSFLLRFK